MRNIVVSCLTILNIPIKKTTDSKAGIATNILQVYVCFNTVGLEFSSTKMKEAKVTSGLFKPIPKEQRVNRKLNMCGGEHSSM